jgi:hypothetical protein
MRSSKLSVAVAAATGLLALAPAAALAHAHPNPNRGRPNRGRLGQSGCRIKLDVAPRLLTAGQPALAYGLLTCNPPTSAATQTVTLYERAAGSPNFTVDGTTQTSETGIFSLTTGAVQSNSQFYVVSGNAQSAHKSVRVSASVTLEGPTETKQLFTGRSAKVEFKGTVSPEDVGAEVVLQRQNALTGNNWARIQLGVVKAGGTFAITHDFRVPGDANIRVLVRSNHRNVPSVSNELNYQISQSENPNLTIVSSQDPISFGSSVNISGVGPKETSVTLLARSAKQTGFTPVAVMKTSSTGAYQFPTQTPMVNTFYRVKSPTESSAVLFEGVKDVLDVTSTIPTTVTAGQTVTFEGTVSPERDGHVVYLERESASGTSFHVVDIAIAEPGATAGESKFTIAYQPYSPGANVYRIKIPGDAQNGGAVSQLFPIEVTAPSPSTLPPPEAPNNSQQPAQGQL